MYWRPGDLIFRGLLLLSGGSGGSKTAYGLATAEPGFGDEAISEATAGVPIQQSQSLKSALAELGTLAIPTGLTPKCSPSSRKRRRRLGTLLPDQVLSNELNSS